MTKPASAFSSVIRPLTLLLDLEHLQAEFYLLASTGEGLGPEDRGCCQQTTVGGRRVEFENPLVESFVREAAEEERNHVRLLRQTLLSVAGEVKAAPALELKASFTFFARAAGLCEAEETFDPFLNDTNLLLAAYIFEDVVLSAYAGSLAAIADERILGVVAGIMAAEAGHSSIIRLMLLASGLTDQTNSISLHRQRLSQLMGTAYQGGDHGVGTLQRPSVIAVDSRSTAMLRPQKQCRQVLCGNEAGKPGLFFPEGLGAPSLLAERRFGPLHSAALFAGEDAGNHRLASHAGEEVALPPLPFTESALTSFDIRENVPTQPWSETAYLSVSAYALSLESAIVHGAVGIVATGETVLDETLWHTDTDRHRYLREDGRVILDADVLEPLDGVTVSILVGGAESYWHSLIDATARLVLVPDEVWERTSRLLLPSTGIKQLEFARLFGLPAHVAPRLVLPTETFRAETLIYPSSLHGLFNYHPSLLNKAFDRLLANVPASDAALPRRIYIDRRGAPLRRLVNEEDVVAALPGYTAVRLETLAIEDQIRLFAHAEVIVAPHGAGLTNIGFATPGSVVVELMMDTYCNWCYRRLAALRGLAYLPVLGRSLDVWKAAESVHLQTWTIAVDDVVATVERAEALRAQRAM